MHVFVSYPRWQDQRLVVTDSTGRFSLDPGPDSECTIIIPGDQVHFSTTIAQVGEGFAGSLRIRLQPPAAGMNLSSISAAAAAHIPAATAVRLRNEARKKITAKDWKAAEASLGKAIEADPNFAALYLDLGVLQFQQGRFAEAEKTFRRGLEADSESTLLLAHLGMSLNAQSRFEEALIPLREATRREPHLAVSRVGLGIALAELGKWKEAEQELQAVVAAGGPLEAQAHLILGKLWMATREPEKSAAAFQEYLRLSPNGPNAPAVRQVLKSYQQETAAQPASPR